MEKFEDSLHRAKVQQLRAWAPFVGQLMTIFRHNMSEDQWTKWKNLESDMSSAMLAGYSESRLSRLETQLNEAKAKYDSLYHHTQLIVMDDDQPTSSHWQPTRKLRVRVARCAKLEKMLSDTLGMPPTRPDEEDSELYVKLDVDTTTSPQLEVSIAISSSPVPGELLTNESVAEEDGLSTAKELIQNVEHEELPEIDQQPEPEKEVEQLQQVEMQVEQQSQVVIVQADKQMSESQADVNQNLVQQQTSGQNIEEQLKSDEDVVMVQKPHLKEQKENELETDAEEDLTTKQRRKGFCSGNKSLFLNFNKFCNKLKSRRSHFSMSGSTNSIGSSTRKNVKDKETQIESKSVPQEAVDENTALSSLLVAQPCPPCYQQQQQLNAAGVGELLCAKTPLTTLDVPGVINCNSELGQQINQISLADASIPLITSETVPLPVATNDDYVITQSITKYYEGPIPAEINLSIEPRPTSSPPKEDRTQNAGNLEHSVATREELQESYLPISVALSQRIRDVLREQPAPSHTNQTISLTTREEATINAAEANNNTSICTIFDELLKDTGFTDDRLYACPFKGCNANLNTKAFVNHVSFHKMSNPKAGPLSCKFCSQMFEKPTALRSHLQHMHHRHKYFCSICLETTVNPLLMLHHVRAVHEAEFQRLNSQQHLLELTAAFDAIGMPKCWASVMEKPFTQKQMKDFLDRLIEELRLRRTNNKLIYRPSEMHLIAKIHGGDQGQLQCGECKYLAYSKDLYKHLLQHRELAVRLAYPVEEATADALQPNQQKLITLVKASKSAQSVAQLNADEIELPIAPAKLPVAGKQIVVSPRCHFVPKELRYKCGVPDCGQHFDSELGFSQHLSTQHNHRDVFECPHCTRTRANHSLILEKVLEHLAHHKRYVYQCGACSSFAPKPSIIDRHISNTHASKWGVDVDVIIHKRDDLTTHTKPAEVRWFKSVNMLRTSTDEWFCNLCPTALATEHQMIGHTELSHQRKHQYCCPYCDYGFKDPIEIVNHIRCSHAGKRIQPLQCYRRVKSKKRYTLGFICNTCHEATNKFCKMVNHCQVAHSNRFQYKCRHCDFGHNNHHLVAAHMTEEHPGMPGLPIQQFDRLDNDMLDVDFWNKAHIFLPKSRMEPPKPVETAQPEPVLPKLLVRLVPEPEQATQIESNSVPQEAVDDNTALSSLLVAQPCPPCCQQQQLNAAGVGELLCAKTPLTTLDEPGVINCNSELGQQINQISLADASIPLITSETVPLPVATNDDYVITQSITKYYEGPIPAEINLSTIEPRPTSSPPKEDRTQNAGNLEHSVATREELQESYLPTSVALSQRIRDVLREQPAPSHTNQTISLTTREEATINAAEANNNTSICTIFDELLKDTGFTAKNNENTEAKPNPAEEATADALQPNQQELINLVKASKSAQSVAQLNADEIELPIAPAMLPVAGKQIVVSPRCHFVPKELRYKCGVPDCGQHFDSELGFSQHLSTQHNHRDVFKCPHCTRDFAIHSLILEKVLEHLAHHKRYVYQCGACSSFASKPSIIYRHIPKKHTSKLGVDVDVIIHKRDDLTTHTKPAEVRWFKSVNVLRTSTDEWFCNLCPTALATEHQMIGHTELSHQRKHQYCCPYCDYGFKDPIKIANHIRCSHAGKRIQPLQCYRRVKSKNRYTLGFICNTCHEATNKFCKMVNHCQVAHSNRFQYKCRHCDFGHNNHHLVAAHMTQEHPGMPGLPIQQFVRLDNDMLDVDFWNKAHIFLPKSRMEPPKPVAPTNHALAIQTFNPIEVSSDEEDDRTYNAECAQKQYEFACSHCTETRRNIDELKSQHWAIKHPKQPFYFCVQPQLCCPVCYDFKGSAKALLEEHLLNVHYIRTLVACDVHQMRECGYCDKTYKGWPELVGHMTSEPHLANDLKNLTDSELNELIKLGSTENKYYQCRLCRVLMPSSVAIAQHGLVDHSGAERSFCFRLVKKNTIIFHCSFCKYASVDELRTLRHMLDHCKRFSKCHLCPKHLNNGFDEYIKHWYSNHRDQVNYFDVVHPYNELKNFLMQVRYQFQNGLIISKNSLRKTRFGHERVIQQLYKELRSKAAQIPFIQLQSRNLTAPQQRQILPTSSTVAAPPKPLPMLQRIAKRRNTHVDPGQLSTTSFLAKRPCL